MTDACNMILLMAASVAAMAFGVLGAYAILRVGFSLLRTEPRPAPIAVRVEPAR